MNGKEEILFNRGSIEQHTSAVKNTSNELRINKAVSISSRSEAMEEFLAVYEELSGAINSYLTLLNKDLTSIDQAAKDMEKLDRSIGNGAW